MELTELVVLAQNNFGDTREGSLAGPVGLFLTALLAVFTVLLIRNMNARLRRLPERFPDQSDRAGSTTGQSDPVGPATGRADRTRRDPAESASAPARPAGSADDPSDPAGSDQGGGD